MEIQKFYSYFDSVDEPSIHASYAKKKYKLYPFEYKLESSKPVSYASPLRDVFEISNFLSQEESQYILDNLKDEYMDKMLYIQESIRVPGVDYKVIDGGYCMRFFNIEFSDRLWKRLLQTNIYNDLCVQKEDGKFIPVGLNPYMRLHKQSSNNDLLPHRDPPIHLNNEYIGMKAVLLYFTDNESGALSILESPDADETTEPIFQIFPKRGKLVVFDGFSINHRVDLIKESRICILTDLFYKKVNDDCRDVF